MFVDTAPGVLPFLPLLYVGWADNVLSPSEVNIIRDKIDEIDWLTPKEKALLADWSDPKKPPADELFDLWITLIKDAVADLDLSEKKTLADLGLLMSAAGSDSKSLEWSTETARSALEDIEKAMGFVDLGNFRNLLTEQQREAEKAKWQSQPEFDPDKMALLLDGKYHTTKQRVRQLLEDPIFRLEIMPDKKSQREKILAWCRLLADQGFGAVSYPEAYGGKNDVAEYTAIFEVLGHHDLSLAVKFGVQFGLFGGSVLQLGTERHHELYLKNIGSLELPGCFAMTETGHGSNVRDLETTATYDPETCEFIIHTPVAQAQKEYIGNALHGEMATVFAQLYTKGINYGVHAFLVPIRNKKGEIAEGVAVEDCGYKLGLNGVDNGIIRFNKVRIPRRNLLDRFANIDEAGNYTSPIESDARRFFTMLGTLVGGRVAVPKAGLSAAKTAISIAILYALKRRQFGPEGESEVLIMDYPSHQKRLMPLLAKAYALSFANEYVTSRFAGKNEEDAREIETLAAALKAYGTWFTTKAIQECREACGGKGYLAENRFAALKADSDIFTTFEGDNVVLMQLAAKGLLTEFKEEISDFSIWDWVGFLADRVESSFREVTVSGLTDEKHLRSGDFHLEAFRFKEKEMLLAVGQRLKRFRKMGLDGYDAYIRCQNHLIDLANAFAERVTLEQFDNAIKQAKDKRIRTVLNRLQQLYALDTIYNGIGWYMEKEFIGPAKAKAIRKMIEKLCLETRQQARFLVHSFQIPLQSLAAPIAF